MSQQMSPRMLEARVCAEIATGPALAMWEGDVNSHPSMSLLLHVVSVRVYDADDQRVVSEFLEFVPLPPPRPRSLG